MDIEKYGFDRTDLLVVTAALADLIENAKAAALISAEAWQPGEGDYQRALSFIQEQLPEVDGKKYVKHVPEKFLRFIADCAAEE